jgi:hypothetical protein
MHFKQFEDCSAIVGDGDITDFINEHFIKTNRTERGFDNIGNGQTSRHYDIG